MGKVHAVLAAAASLCLASAAFAHDFGPAPGDTLPAPITAPDASGASQSFETLVGAKGLVLAFNRSADWCPYCQRQLMGLEGVRAQIEARGWKLAAITTDTPDKLARFAARRHIGFPMLSDPDSAIIGAFNLMDPAYPEGRRHHGVPVPTVYFVTPDRVIVAKLGDANFRVRPAPEEVVATIDRLGN
jgi:peroxiredoxin